MNNSVSSNETFQTSNETFQMSMYFVNSVEQVLLLAIKLNIIWLMKLFLGIWEYTE